MRELRRNAVEYLRLVADSSLCLVVRQGVHAAVPLGFGLDIFDDYNSLTVIRWWKVGVKELHLHEFGLLLRVLSQLFDRVRVVARSAAV